MGWPGTSFLGEGEAAAKLAEDRRERDEPKLERARPRPPRVDDLRFTLVLLLGVLGVAGDAAATVGFNLDGLGLLAAAASSSAADCFSLLSLLCMLSAMKASMTTSFL